VDAPVSLLPRKPEKTQGAWDEGSCPREPESDTKSGTAHGETQGWPLSDRGSIPRASTRNYQATLWEYRESRFFVHFNWVTFCH